MDCVLKSAADRLEDGCFTCVLHDGLRYVESRERGVKPLLALIESEADYTSYSAADRVIGKAAAMLYVLLGIKSVYADIISEPALKVFNDNDVSAEYGVLVPGIVNRTNTGPCPMETAVMDITDPAEGMKAVIKKLGELID